MPFKETTKEEMKKHYNSIRNFKDKSDSYYFNRRAECLSTFLNNVPPTTRILNLGCGDGKFSDFLKQQGFSNIVDVDISISLLKFDKHSKKILGDAENISFKEKTFDVLLMTDVIEHIENRKKTVYELFRVLKKDGHVFITYPNPLWVPLFNFLGKAGLKVDAKDSKVLQKVFENEIKEFFEIESFKTIMLASKLPHKILNIFETIETRLSPEFMNHLGMMHVYVIKKR